MGGFLLACDQNWHRHEQSFGAGLGAAWTGEREKTKTGKAWSLIECDGFYVFGMLPMNS